MEENSISPLPDGERRTLPRIIRQLPVLSLVCAASVLGWWATFLWQQELFVRAFHLLTFVPFYIEGSALRFVPYEVVLGTGQLWRHITPAFLHFSFMHLVFNVAVVCELGRRAEAVEGSMRFAGLILVLAALSNLAQFLLEPTPLFGGLSGINYGLVGFVAVRRLLDPLEIRWHVSKVLLAVLIASMMLLSMGIGEPVGLKVANGAHWGGFVVGLAIAWLMPRGRTER